MSRTIRFVGGPRFKDGHAYATPPLVGPVKTRPLTDIYTGKTVLNADGTPVLEEVNGWEVGDEVTFDRALAEQHGRLSKTDDKDDGEEWAQLHLDTWNNGHAEGEEPFQFVGPKPVSKSPARKRNRAKKQSPKAVNSNLTPSAVAVETAGE